MTNSLPLVLLTLNQLGERIEENLALPVPDLDEIHEIALMLKNYRLGIQVGVAIDGANVSAVATITTDYEVATWYWEAGEGRRESESAYRVDAEELESILEQQATAMDVYEGDEDDDE